MLQTKCVLCLFLIALFLSASLNQNAHGTSAVRRITLTRETSLNLNPALSGDGRILAFESTEDFIAAGGDGFHALRAKLCSESESFVQMGLTRAVSPSLSQDGSRIAFASKDNPLGNNPDGNSEIFLFKNSSLVQITNTTADIETERISDGSFQPSISDDGGYIAFSSNRDLIGQNPDLNFEIFIYDTSAGIYSQLTNTTDIYGAEAVKISGDGTTLAYVKNYNSTRDLVLLRRNGSPAQIIAKDLPTLNLAYGRVISDDGFRIVYSAETTPFSTQPFLWDGKNNVTRQLTQLESREDDVPLQATISGDGLRVAFATRRDLIGTNSDHSIELYIADIPSGQLESITNAPASATAEVIASLNDDGSLVAFSFPRVLAGMVSSNSFANNPEIFVANVRARPLFGSLLSIVNGAAQENEPTAPTKVAADSIAIAFGNALAYKAKEAQRLPDKSFPLNVAGTSVSVNGRSAQILSVSPTQVNFVVPGSTEIGSAEVIVTNADGFRSRGMVSIVSSAPGVFTLNGEGNGEGVILNADTLQQGPFDLSAGPLRLSIFVTGTRQASNVSVLGSGRPFVVESINVSPDLPGLDEIHVLVPAAFRGVGAIDLVVRADGHASNSAAVTFTGTAIREVRINEVLADPPDGLAGDANHDGVRSSIEDEFVELVNNGGAVNLSGWTIRTRSLSGTSETTRHTFAAGTILLAGEAIEVFGGGNFDPADPIFGCTQVVATSSAGLSLVNGGLDIIVRDAAGELVTEFTYGGATDLEGDNNQSLTRSPDISGNFVEHTAALGANGRRYSPGLRTNGTPFVVCVGRLNTINLAPLATTIAPGETTNLVAQALDVYGRPRPGVPLTFTSDSAAIATVDAVTANDVTNTFTATITGHAAGTAHITAQAIDGVTTVTAVATVTVITPTAEALLVINQVYGGGNNSGATFQNDFVELFNPGITPVDFSVTPHSLQYASASGNFTSANKLDLTSGVIAPGQFFLIRLAGGTTNGSQLPPADAATSIINLSAADGKIALVRGTATLAGSGCPIGTTVADFVGYGAANCAEGIAVGSLNATKSARRTLSCSDTNLNANDFVVVTNPPPPNNSLVAALPCP